MTVSNLTGTVDDFHEALAGEMWSYACCGEWNAMFGSLRLLNWVRETDGLQCNRCTGRTAPGRWPAAPWSSRCLLRETGFTLRAFISGTARPGSASTARQSEELRLRQVSTLQRCFFENRKWPAFLELEYQDPATCPFPEPGDGSRHIPIQILMYCLIFFFYFQVFKVFSSGFFPQNPCM